MCNSDTSGIESGQSERHSSKESDSSFDSPERIIDVTKWVTKCNHVMTSPDEPSIWKGIKIRFHKWVLFEPFEFRHQKFWWQYFLLNPASKSSICSSSVTIVHKLKKRTLVNFDWPIAVNQSELFCHFDTLLNLNEIVSYCLSKKYFLHSSCSNMNKILLSIYYLNSFEVTTNIISRVNSVIWWVFRKL